jgi:hypothetical protein
VGTHWLVQDIHLAGREVAAVGEDPEDWVEAEGVVAFHVVEDRVDPVEGEEAQDPAYHLILPLFRRTNCLDRGRLTEELVET